MDTILLNYKCEGQMSIFDCICERFQCKPGTYIEDIRLGEELTFEDITKEVGNLIAIDVGTEGENWYIAVIVEKIHINENGTRRLVYFDGNRQRRLVDEMYFEKGRRNRLRAWRLRC